MEESLQKRVTDWLCIKLKARFDIIHSQLEEDIKKWKKDDRAEAEARVKERVERTLKLSHPALTPDEVQVYAKAACSDILSELLKQNNAIRADMTKLGRDIESLQTADSLFMTTEKDKIPQSSAKKVINESLEPATFWKLVFIEGQQITASRFQKLAQIDFQLTRLWNCLMDEISEKVHSISAGSLISAVQKYVSLEPAPGTFSIALNKMFALLRLWNFESNSLTPEFQQKVKNMFFTDLQVKFQSRRKFRLPHHPDFLKNLCATDFGPNAVDHWSKFTPKKLSKNLSLKAALILSFFLGNRAPEFDNIFTQISDSFLLQIKRLN